LLHLVGSSVLLYLIDDARSNKVQEWRKLCRELPDAYFSPYIKCNGDAAKDNKISTAMFKQHNFQIRISALR